MRSESPTVPLMSDLPSDWPRSDSQKNEKHVLRPRELKMKLAAKQPRLVEMKKRLGSLGSAKRDSEDRQLLMQRGGRNPEGNARLLGDHTGRRDFGLGSMVPGMMKDIGLIGARVGASTPRMAGEMVLGGCFFHRHFLCCLF